MKRGGLHSELGAVEDATVTQRLLRCDYMVTGLLKRGTCNSAFQASCVGRHSSCVSLWTANVEGSSFFELQLDQWGRVFHGSIYCDGKDRRWAGVKCVNVFFISLMRSPHTIGLYGQVDPADTVRYSGVVGRRCFAGVSRRVPEPSPAAAGCFG